VQADSTVISANVAYPTDSGLLVKAVGKLARTVRRVQAVGEGTGTRSGCNQDTSETGSAMAGTPMAAITRPSFPAGAAYRRGKPGPIAEQLRKFFAATDPT
jgi:hypothetical protein